MQPEKKQWLVRGGFGALFIGLGLCVIIEAAFLKHEGFTFWKWTGIGTIGLVVFISGLRLLINAVLFRIKMDD